MCELFGICSARSFRANELLDTFYHHSNVHKDGWGLAVFYGNGVSMEKEPVRAIDSRYLSNRLSRPVICTNLLAHIRLATVGRIEYANCHPFIWDDKTGRTWTLIHNGTCFDPHLISPFVESQEGTTDSERILMYIVSRVNEETNQTDAPLTGAQRMQLLDRIILDLSYDNKLNMLLYDGEYMYVHTNCEGTLNVLEREGARIFATTPLIFDGWKPVPMNQLQVFRDGELVFSGTPHNNKFLEEEHDMTPLFAAFSEL